MQSFKEILQESYGLKETIAVDDPKDDQRIIKLDWFTSKDFSIVDLGENDGYDGYASLSYQHYESGAIIDVDCRAFAHATKGQRNAPKTGVAKVRYVGIEKEEKFNKFEDVETVLKNFAKMFPKMLKDSQKQLQNIMPGWETDQYDDFELNFRKYVRKDILINCTLYDPSEIFSDMETNINMRLQQENGVGSVSNLIDAVDVNVSSLDDVKKAMQKFEASCMKFLKSQGYTDLK